jgi:hypothetical protein
VRSPVPTRAGHGPRHGPCSVGNPFFRTGRRCCSGSHTARSGTSLLLLWRRDLLPLSRSADPPPGRLCCQAQGVCSSYGGRPRF